MDEQLQESLKNAISTDQLYKEYNWYQDTFPKTVQEAYDEFFNPNFKLELIGISKNINYLLDKESCFVTKIRIDYEYDMFFRLTDEAIEIILNRALGQSKQKFNINKLSEIEAKVITAFNDFTFNHLKQHIHPAPTNELKRVNFDLIHLTFTVQDLNDFNRKAGKVIVTLPLALLKPEEITSTGDKFAETDFPDQHTIASILVGKTKFSVYDLKHLETEDVVVFEDSSLEDMTLTINGEKLPISLNPNMDLLITDEQDGGDGMSNSNKNIWDSIEVEMIAEFDSVKITLGELKDIEEGLVVDLASLYENNVTLKVEDKKIAAGSLVIVNDRYGVKINKVIAGADEEIPTRPKRQASSQVTSDEDVYEENNYNEATEEYEEVGDEYSEDEYSEDGYNEESSEEEEFDYSDFELDDDNI